MEENFEDLRLKEIGELKPMERILKTAYNLFNKYGFNTVGIDRIILESSVSKRTFYKYFPSKNDLIVATMDFREWLRFIDMEKRVVELNAGPKEEILAIFDSLFEWFAEEDFNGCTFNRALAEFNYTESKDLRIRVDKHFEKWIYFISERLKQFKPAEKIMPLTLQILSLITGSGIIAHASGESSIASLNKKLANTLLETF